MKIQVARDQPWQPERARLALRGRMLVRLRPGEDPPGIATHQDVQVGRALASTRLDGGRLDRAVRAFSPAARFTRAFPAARQVGRAEAAGRRHVGYDELEQSLGLSRTFRLEVDPDASLVNLVSELGALDVVEMATPHYMCEAPFAAPPGLSRAPLPLPPDYAQQMVGAREALALEAGDSALIVGIVDSGVALGHPEMEGRLRPGLDTVDLPPEAVSRGLKLFGDYQSRDRRPQDEMGHGTACASLIGARGAEMPPGLAGAARVLPVRALAAALLSERDEPTAVGGIPDIDLAVKSAVDLGARVLNLSFGTPETALREDDPIPHAEVVRYALARGCVLVAASGNSGSALAYYPAALAGVIAVGSVGPAGLVSRFMSSGEHVALCAPGERLRAATLSGYEEQNGTSFASPLVAGAAALLLAHAARFSSSLTPQAVRRLLVKTARPFRGEAPAGCGAGILDVPAALRAAEEAWSAEDAVEDRGSGVGDRAQVAPGPPRGDAVSNLAL